MRPILEHSFSKSSNPKDRDGLTTTTRQQSTLVSLRWENKVIKTYGKREVAAMLNEYKNCTTLICLGPKTQ